MHFFHPQFHDFIKMPLAFSPYFIIMAGKIFQVSHLNLTVASVWKAHIYLQRLCSCCLSLTAFADLQFRMKVVSSVTSNELLSRMPLICINLPSTMLQIQAFLIIWSEPAVWEFNQLAKFGAKEATINWLQEFTNPCYYEIATAQIQFSTCMLYTYEYKQC